MPGRAAAVDGDDRVARHGLTAALFIVLLGPAAAEAQELDPGATYGGGWVGADRQLWLRAAVDDTRRSVRFTGRFEAGCAAGSIASDPVPAEGLAALATAGTTRDGAVVTRWRLTGRLAQHDGSGTLDATVRVRRGGRTVRSCSVSVRPWLLSTGLSSTSAADDQPPPGSRWYGTVEGGGTVAVVASRRRRQLATVALSMDLGFCPRRPAAGFWAVIHRVPVDGDGFVNALVRDTIRAGGLVRRVRISLNGGFRFGRLEPMVAIREVVRSARTGRRLWACDTESLTGTASMLPAQ